MAQSGRSSAFQFGGILAVTALVAAPVAGARVLGLLASSAGVALPAAAFAAIGGVLIGLAVAKTDALGRRLATVVLAGLLILPLQAVVAGWSAALGFRGWVTALSTPSGAASAWLDGWRGAVALHALAATPLVALLSSVVLRAVDRRREEQAVLDASPPRVLLAVTLRDAAPALVAVVVLAAVTASTEIAATDLFRVRTFAEEVYTQAAVGALDAASWGDRGAVGLAAGVALLSIAFLAPLTIVATRFEALVQSDGATWKAPLWRWRPLASIALGLSLVTLAGTPIGSLVYKAGETVARDGQAWSRTWAPGKFVRAVAESPWRHRRELMVSATTGLCVSSASLVAGGLAAWACRHASRRRRALLAVAAIGMAIPGPVVGLATLRLLNQPTDSPLALLGDLYGTSFAPWLAQTLRLAPIAALLMLPTAASVPESLLEAARADGAGSVSRLLRVAVPMRWPALVAVWVVLFALSVGEVSATALVTPPGTPPLSVRQLSLLHYGVEDRVAALSLVLFAAYTAAAWLAIWLYGRATRSPDRVS